mgnify:CR=1 FL=1|tara:strand:+ start:413 stop:673 length:261 start_codon:yes stop_codon:yes gene_type:complete
METPPPPPPKTIARQSVCNQRYRNKNREKYNDYMREYQRKRIQDPVIREKLRVNQLKYYAKKKAKKLAEKKLAEKPSDEEILLQPK